MPNENKTYDLKVEKTIPKPAAEVFRAIGEGRLFLNCSADHESLKVDFRVGGKYSIEFISYNMKNCGEFLEIIPNRKIVFTWCQDYDSNPTPDTTVSVELTDLGDKTGLVLTHTGFADAESRDAHQGGWSGGLDDLGQEMVIGKLRLARKYSMPIEKLYEICKNPATFFARMSSSQKGEFLETIPNQKIVYNWKVSPNGETLPHPTKVTLLFESEDDKSAAWIELLHEGLDTEAQQKIHRAGWDLLLKKLMR